MVIQVEVRKVRDREKSAREEGVFNLSVICSRQSFSDPVPGEETSEHAVTLKILVQRVPDCSHPDCHV